MILGICDSLAAHFYLNYIIKSLIMTQTTRFKFPKTVLFGITAIYVAIMIITYYMYYKEPYIFCAKRVLLSQAIALGFQVVLNYVNFHSRKKIVILATLFISAMLLSGVLSSFFKLELMCRYLGF